LFVPASELNGGSSDLRLDGGDREGPDCFCKSFSGIFSAIVRDLCVISSFYEIFCNLLYIHRVELMRMLPGPSGHSALPFKKKVCWLPFGVYWVASGYACM
jgi:hypothetical protein